MLKEEFEQLAMREHGTITSRLYDAIESYYMSDSYYHQQFGGVDEDKYQFVKRVFGGKVNTPKSVMKKITAEAIRENRWCLRNHNLTEQELKQMDERLTEHYQFLATCKCI